ncbi:MAG: hypothetical protein HDQ95_01365 [Roseburia sp.]|nr:hypothetical protein [Roseburia sp.]
MQMGIVSTVAQILTEIKPFQAKILIWVSKALKKNIGRQIAQKEIEQATFAPWK